MMLDRVLTGTRVRNRRLDLGLRQAQVAKDVGISGSYLNLIEHNRRRIGATLLDDLARVLAIDVDLLEKGSDAQVLGPLSQAAAAFPAISVEATRAEELVARFPGWAQLVAAQRTRIAQLEARTQALSDRLAHDTQIATALHDVISTATAIRSTASILVETPDLDPDWLARFHGNIDVDAGRLADSSQALLGFLDMEMEAGGDQDASPLEQAEAIMATCRFYLSQAEAGEVAEFDAPNRATQAILTAWAQDAARDAQILPLAPFLQAARAVAFDPARLSARFGISMDVVMRRLAHLPDAPDIPPMGLAICDAAGVVTFQKPVLDFRLPRAGAACPLWPLFQSLCQPGRALRRVVRLPGVARTPFDCIAIATPEGEVDYDTEPRIRSTMLVRPARGGGVLDTAGSDTVGPGCRICPVNDCAARRHPSLL